MRNNNFLINRMNEIWQECFSDQVISSQIRIKFGRRARKRLGSIRESIQNDQIYETLILINGHFKNLEVPDFVIDATIAHELCHYVHGFGSASPQKHQYPHRGGVIEKEMESRGLTELIQKEKDWLNKNWFRYIDSSC